MLLGRQRSGTLRVNEDSVGLYFRCNVANTIAGRDAFNLIKRGDISGCSFAFAIDGTDGDNWDETISDPEDGRSIVLRKISRAKLYDVSVVTSPAYQDTSIDTDDDDDTGDDILELNKYRAQFPDGVPASFPQEIRSHIQRAKLIGGPHRRLIDFILS
jgi:HK97 family phage prohead protease